MRNNISEPTLIIAEAGVNHNGSLELAFELIDAASEAGADLVKFQTFKAENLVTNLQPKRIINWEQPIQKKLSLR